MQEPTEKRYFTSYTGTALPLKLVGPLDADQVDGRISYFEASYDDDERVLSILKVVYGEVEFAHCYEYADDGKLLTVTLTEGDEEPQQISLA